MKYLIILFITVLLLGCTDRDINKNYPSEMFRLNVSEQIRISVGGYAERISYCGTVQENRFSIARHSFREAYNVYYPMEARTFKMYFYDRTVLFQKVSVTNEYIELIILRVENK